MHEIFVNFLKSFISYNEKLFAPLDSIVNSMPFAPWILDALKDSLHMFPFLFFIFLLIEIVEYYFSGKTESLANYSKKAGPLAGSLLASMPQCGFSVIASTLYTKRLITRGTLLAVYISTSDEAIPVLLTDPSKIHAVLLILAVKIVIAIAAGYSIDFFTSKTENETRDTVELHEGCCHHSLSKPKKSDLIIHPIVHTLNVFVFILLVTLVINFLVLKAGSEENLGQYFLVNSYLQPVAAAVFGLIPNCAVSIAITLMYLKGALSFGSAIAGLCSGAGLGILVLFRKNKDLKDTLKIVGLLLLVSMISGILIQFFCNWRV